MEEMRNRPFLKANSRIHGLRYPAPHTGGKHGRSSKPFSPPTNSALNAFLIAVSERLSVHTVHGIEVPGPTGYFSPSARRGDPRNLGDLSLKGS